MSFCKFLKNKPALFCRRVLILPVLLIAVAGIISSCATFPKPAETTTTTTKPATATTKFSTTTTRPAATTTTTRPATTTTAISTTATTIPSSSRTTLHLIVVADTNDFSIGASVATDSKNMQNFMETIVSQSSGRIFLNKIVFQGYSVTQENILGAIHSLRVGSGDMIVFLYAGHGYRYQSTASKWPLLNTLNRVTDFNEVIQKIKSKNARQFIALADCCNSFMDVGVRKAPPEPRDVFPYENIRRLFLTSEVKIAASGSKPGQSAFGENINGGFFTSAFIMNLRRALLDPAGNWRTVLENSRRDVLARSGYEQEPQYEISGE